MTTNTYSTSIHNKTKYVELVVQLYVFKKLVCITRKIYILTKLNLYTLSYEYVN